MNKCTLQAAKPGCHIHALSRLVRLLTFCLHVALASVRFHDIMFVAVQCIFKTTFILFLLNE